MLADHRKLASEAQALKATGRIAEAIAVYERIVALAPESAVAEHNLAAALGDAGRWRLAEPHIRQAFTKGIDAPESWLVLARCLQAMAQLDDADRTLTEALRRRPTFYDAHDDLAQLRWMRTGDIASALADLDDAIRAAPADGSLLLIKAKALEQAGRVSEAYEILASLAAADPKDVVAATRASQTAAAAGDCTAALEHATRAAAVQPADSVVALTLAAAHLAAGQPERASALAEAVRLQAPNDQFAIALQATAWRLLGDRRYNELYDYAALVQISPIDRPEGWRSLNAYLADLAGALKAAHAFQTHPFNQSIRHGSQSPNILEQEHPAIAALPEALDGPIRHCIASLGKGADPVRARNTGAYACQGIWSICMSAGGFHTDHVHPNGWLSSACYVEPPRDLPGKEGWLKLGQPGVPTQPPLSAEHFVEPAAGRLVLFPSYMWHGTIPFTKAATRLTVAFDLAPGQGAWG